MYTRNMEDWDLIHTIYANYEKKQDYIFHFSDEVDNINKLITDNILDPESFTPHKGNKTMKQLTRDPFTKKGWEYFLGM
jgi:hypothetical protein